MQSQMSEEFEALSEVFEKAIKFGDYHYLMKEFPQDFLEKNAGDCPPGYTNRDKIFYQYVLQKNNYDINFIETMFPSSFLDEECFNAKTSLDKFKELGEEFFEEEPEPLNAELASGKVSGSTNAYTRRHTLLTYFIKNNKFSFLQSSLFSKDFADQSLGTDSGWQTKHVYVAYLLKHYTPKNEFGVSKNLLGTVSKDTWDSQFPLTEAAANFFYDIRLCELQIKINTILDDLHNKGNYILQERVLDYLSRKYNMHAPLLDIHLLDLIVDNVSKETEADVVSLEDRLFWKAIHIKGESGVYSALDGIKAFNTQDLCSPGTREVVTADCLAGGFSDNTLQEIVDKFMKEYLTEKQKGGWGRLSVFKNLEMYGSCEDPYKYNSNDLNKF